MWNRFMPEHSEAKGPITHLRGNASIPAELANWIPVCNGHAKTIHTQQLAAGGVLCYFIYYIFAQSG